MSVGMKTAIATITVSIGGLDAALALRTVTIGATILGGAGLAEVTVQVIGRHPALTQGAVAVALLGRQGH